MTIVDETMRSRRRVLYRCWIVVWMVICPDSWGAPSSLDLALRLEYSNLLLPSSRSLGSSQFHDATNERQRHDDHNTLRMLRSRKILSVPRGGGDVQQPSSWSSVSQAAMNEFWKTHPLVAGGSVCAIKATLAGLLAQKIQHASSNTSSSPHKFDFRRTLAFMMYGALYQGMCNRDARWRIGG